MMRMERVKSSDLRASSKSVRSFIERSTMTKALLKILGVVGVSLVMSGTLLESALQTFDCCSSPLQMAS